MGAASSKPQAAPAWIDGFWLSRMRKIAFVSAENAEGIKKVMIYEDNHGVYIFGYNTVYDRNCVFDEWYEALSDAEECCADVYGVQADDWIFIADPLEYCNLDYIMPVRIKGRNVGKPRFDCWEVLQDGEWRSFQPLYDEAKSFEALLANERLFLSGLMDEFEKARQTDKDKARKILAALGFDAGSRKESL
ncbi:MAG: hypothetical protein LBD04_12835 [Synergistaceae bacterium]|jgi:biofilm protein TabA|nr:hypothetical protein [Synergistaceae bacterium]